LMTSSRWRRANAIASSSVAFLGIEYDASHKLRWGGGARHAGGGFLHVASRSKARSTIWASAQANIAKLRQRSRIIEHVELDALFVTPQQHRHVAVLLLEGAGRRLDREWKAKLLEHARQCRLGWQLAAKEHVHLNRHGTRPRMLPERGGIGRDTSSASRSPQTR